MKWRLFAAAVAALLMAAPSGRAQEEADGLWSHLINRGTTASWTVTPERPAPRVVEADGVPGGGALRVRARRGANPWDVQATSPAGGDISAGDIVLVSFYARAEQAAEGGSRLAVRLQLAGAPYTALLEGTKNIGAEWRQYCLSGMAAQEFRADLTNVSLHLATGDQVIDLGPVFVFNLGGDFDRSQLPDCSE